MTATRQRVAARAEALAKAEEAVATQEAFAQVDQKLKGVRIALIQVGQKSTNLARELLKKDEVGPRFTSVRSAAWLMCLAQEELAEAFNKFIPLYRTARMRATGQLPLPHVEEALIKILPREVLETETEAPCPLCVPVKETVAPLQENQPSAT